MIEKWSQFPMIYCIRLYKYQCIWVLKSIQIHFLSSFHFLPLCGFLIIQCSERCMFQSYYFWGLEKTSRPANLHVLDFRTYLLLRQRLSEYEAPPPQVREHSLHGPQASHRPSRSSSERAVLELCNKGENSQHILWSMCLETWMTSMSAHGGFGGISTFSETQVLS